MGLFQTKSLQVYLGPRAKPSQKNVWLQPCLGKVLQLPYFVLWLSNLYTILRSVEAKTSSFDNRSLGHSESVITYGGSLMPIFFYEDYWCFQEQTCPTLIKNIILSKNIK